MNKITSRPEAANQPILGWVPGNPDHKEVEEHQGALFTRHSPFSS